MELEFNVNPVLQKKDVTLHCAFRGHGEQAKLPTDGLYNCDEQLTQFFPVESIWNPALQVNPVELQFENVGQISQSPVLVGLYDPVGHETHEEVAVEKIVPG